MHNKRLKMLPLTAAVLLTWAGTASALDFHGYFRSGIGASSKDGGLECFKLAGAYGNQNFRLGNECTTYGEVQFDQGVYEGKPVSTGEGAVKFDYHVMFGYEAAQNNDFENLGADPNHIALRQNYVDAKNLPFLNGGAAWIGKRYYQRHDIHINDFFYMNTSAPGAGVEKIGLVGEMNTSFAILRHNGNNTVPTGTPPVANNPNNNASTVLDWRLAGIGFGGLGALEVGALYAKEDTKLPNSKNGFGGWAEWSLKILGGVNKLYGYYGNDSAARLPIDQNANNQLACISDPTRFNCDQGWGVLDHISVDLSPSFSGSAAIGYYDFKNDYTWFFGGVRPVWHISDYFKLQGELGYNEVKASGQSKAYLTKIVIAPTLVAGRGFWARPELRVFYAYNKWNDKARDGVFGPANGVVAGGNAGPFGGSTNGAVWGFQAEAWW
jgi:maltoporin